MPDTAPRVIGGLLVIMLCAPLLAGGLTTAQPGTATPQNSPPGTPQQSPPSTSQPTATNSPSAPPPTNATTATQTGGGGVGSWVVGGAKDIASGLSNVAGDVNNAVSGAVNGAVQAADNAYRGAMKEVFGPLRTVMVEVPTFDVGLFDDSPGLHAPENWPFSQLWPLYIVIQVLTGSFLTIVIASGFAKLGYPFQNTYKTTQLALRGVKAMLVAVVAHLFLIALLHMTITELASAIAPTTDQLANDFGKVLTTTGVAGIIGGKMGKEVIMWLIKMWTLIWAALMFFPIISGPLFAAWQFNPKSTLGHLSGTLIWLYFGLLLSKLLVAVDLRAAWMLDWGQGTLGPLNILVSIAFFWLAFFIPPGVLVAILFGRSRALSALSGAAAGAVSGGYVSSKVSQKGRSVKESVASHAKQRANKQVTKRTKQAKSTAKSARRRASVAAGRATANRIGHRRRPRESSGQTYSSGSSFSGWKHSRDSTNGKRATADGTDDASSRTSSTATGSTSTKTTAQQIRNLKHRTRQRGHGTPEDRRRYYDLQDQRKYGDQIDYQQASGAKKGAKRRYGSVGGSSGSSSASRSSASRSRTSNGSQTTHQDGDET